MGGQQGRSTKVHKPVSVGDTQMLFRAIGSGAAGKAIASPLFAPS